ncbi:glycosyltransferase [Dokdonia donghaensis]|uniref:Glycosyl transferase family 1 domain-containing protein n=1 Tax=Dokdonia donghaensis DSW-1 TaxID=1300343 RepID=A0A0A2GTQ1_9FLAO|nr:glycosyltransferase [Dokdonia donghaensis]ANH61084.1 UDP-D-galactose:(glucosyl)lipopolysaccharide-1,6-D-galactosyltransferase [Dokdonia donghaensis DSW-1]KGO05696.1 hypothetical protein NV36_01740 [Dokdonia donghaensis DSW-1]
MKTIIITGAFRFPEGDAAAKRVLGLGQMLRDLGYKVIFAGGEQVCNLSTNYFDGFEYHSLAELDNDYKGFKKVTGFFKRGNKRSLFVKNILFKNTNIKAIILYNSTFIEQVKLSREVRKYSIPIIGDCTEWYESSHLPGGRFGPVAIDNFLKMKFGYPYLKNVIVISTFLQDWYRKYNMNVLRIPPLLLKGNSIALTEVKNQLLSTPNHSLKKLLYAGNPGKKDELEILINILSETRFKKSFCINIIGVSKEDFLKYSPNISISENVLFHGKMPHSEVLNFYAKSDFSVILRENKRFAKAGFSTKLIESLSMGIPVLISDNGETREIILNDYNGVIIDSLDKLKIVESLEFIRNISDEQLFQMKQQALKSSLDFSQKKYLNAVKVFLDKILIQ